jgi:hypothetical protein
MAEAAQRVLMNEFKQLSKEKWTNIEVSCPRHMLEMGCEVATTYGAPS